MKTIKKLLLPIAAIAAFAGTSHAMEQADKYLFCNYRKKFTNAELNRYLVDPSLKSALDEYSKFGPIVSNSNDDVKKITLDKQEYYVKLMLHRIIGSALINELANEYNLDTVKAPTKGIYEDQNGNRYVIAPAIKAVNTPFSFSQIKQIYKIIQTSAFDDVHKDNILNTHAGIAYFVDTERKSFANAAHLSEWQEGEMRSSLQNLEIQLPMTDEADEWLLGKMKHTARCL